MGSGPPVSPLDPRMEFISTLIVNENRKWDFIYNPFLFLSFFLNPLLDYIYLLMSPKWLPLPHYHI